MNPLAALTDEFLADHFDPQSLLRARDYVDHAVEALEVSQLSKGSVTATADVIGTRPTPYRVQLHAEVGPHTGRGWVFSVCTCPVRSMCKHGAAVAIALRQDAAGAADGPGWQQRLGRLVDGLTQQERAALERIPLALEISLDDGRRTYGAGRRRVRLRPMRPGSRQKWVRSGVDWSDLGGPVVRMRHPPAQAAAVGTLQSMLRANRAYPVAGVPPSLDDFGDQVVRLLRDAAAAGVELLPGSGLTSVTISDAPVELVAELTRDRDGVRLQVAASAGDRRWTGDQVVPIGHPANVLALVDEDGGLTLAETNQPAHATVVELLEDDPLTVPEADVEEFLARLLPVVRMLPVRSPDDSVTVPQPVSPVLQVTVVWLSSTAAELTWEWRYGEARCLLGSRDLLGGIRDRAAERAIRDRVPAELFGRDTVTGGDALVLAIHELPHLRTIDDVEVVEIQRPDFRETSAAPEISFEVVEPAVDDHTDWLDLEVTVTVEGEAIPLPEVLAALTLDLEYLVLPSGLFVSTDRPEFARLREVVLAASELRERAGDRMSVGKQDLGLWAQLAELGLVDDQAEEWVRRAQALRDLTAIPRPEPGGVVTPLRSYQREGFWWLAFLWEHGLGGILADDMGLGKTLQVLALICHARSRRPAEGPFLVVAPTSVVTAWSHEAQRHAPNLRVGLVSRRTDDVAAIAAESDVVVTTYTLLRLAHGEYAGVRWGGLVIDEAQQVKNHQSKTYGAARTITAPFKLAVTGTPFENRLMELWALLSITVPGLYPWPRKFGELVVRPVEKQGDQVALQRFRHRIRPFVLRRTKELVADDLPPKQEQVLDVTLERRHRKIYDTHLAKERQRILGLVEDFDRNRVAIFSALTKLRQLALDPALVDPEHDRVGSAKLELLIDHLAEITEEGHRALVFSQFTSFLQRVRHRLEQEGIATVYLDGTTRDRAAVIERFREGAAAAFLISLKAGGVGLTLTEADYVFVLDPWWNPAAENQAVDRAHRIGQTQHVHVYRLVAADTIEEKVMELKGRKAELFTRVIDGDGAMSTAIDADDIRRLFDE